MILAMWRNFFQPGTRVQKRDLDGSEFGEAQITISIDII